jgi:sugar (pentulose or hexulose) kinase
MTQESSTRATIVDGQACLGIELGSTRIKACLTDDAGTILATGSASWENQLVEGLWTYPLEAVRTGLQAAYASLVAAAEERHGASPTSYGAIGVSAMMHGYLAFDAEDELLVPFRTWRNTNTGPAAAALTEAFGQNIPLRWSIAHLYQAMLDREPHVPRVRWFTTLAGYVHRLLTGRRVLGAGDASGMFPLDPASGDYDAASVLRFQELAAAEGQAVDLADLLPSVLPAGAEAGTLTPEGAALLDPTGALEAGTLLCPPEGDAGTGMVATNAVRPRTGNVSAGTSIFAMVVLERPLDRVHPEIDIVTTPDAHLVAMVHCNNGSSELGAWVGLFGEFAAALGNAADPDEVFQAVLGDALDADVDADGLLAYNLLSGEPIAGVDEGRPLFVRTPGSRLTLAGFARAQLYGVFAALSLGMRTLTAEGVTVDTMFAHGGLFRTGGVAQRALAAAIASPVAVSEGAGEGGSWGIAVLAAYARAVRDGAASPDQLAAWLEERIFRSSDAQVVAPSAADITGYAAFLERWRKGLAIERAAIAALE